MSPSSTLSFLSRSCELIDNGPGIYLCEGSLQMLGCPANFYYGPEVCVLSSTASMCFFGNDDCNCKYVYIWERRLQDVLLLIYALC